MGDDEKLCAGLSIVICAVEGHSPTVRDQHTSALRMQYPLIDHRNRCVESIWWRLTAVWFMCSFEDQPYPPTDINCEAVRNTIVPFTTAGVA
jgi:hypothetical protein